MRRKGFYVLALVAMLGAAAGCGTDAEDTLGKVQEGQVTEALQPTEEPSATATPEPTATPAPTATPVPKNYMEKNGIRVLGAGCHEYKGFIWTEVDERDRPILETATCEGIFEVEEEDNGDGTKTITAKVYSVPYEYEDGAWCYATFSGFVDLKTGKSFIPYDLDYEHKTYLRQEDKNFEITVKLEQEPASVTNPYKTETYTVVCPSEYEDAGFYLTGHTANPEAFAELPGNWKLLQFVKHGTSEMVVFSVKEGLATMPTDALQERIARGSAMTTENYFEANGLTARGEGKTTYRGTEYTCEGKLEDYYEDDLVIETKDVEIEFQRTEELLDDGRKQIRGSFIYPADIVTEEFEKGVSSISGIVDKKTGLCYSPFAAFLAEPVVLECNGEEITMMIADEGSFTEDNRGIRTYVITCPQDYDDVAFFITGNYRNEELRKRLGTWLPISEVEHGESDMVFFE